MKFNINKQKGRPYHLRFTSQSVLDNNSFKQFLSIESFFEKSVFVEWNKSESYAHDGSLVVCFFIGLKIRHKYFPLGDLRVPIMLSFIFHKAAFEYVCPICNQIDVRMRGSDNPNCPGIDFEPSADEDDYKNSYCNNCEQHISLIQKDLQTTKQPLNNESTTVNKGDG